MTKLRQSIHMDHVHPKWGVEQVGWLGQSGTVYALDEAEEANREPGGFSPLYQPRDESCGHVNQSTCDCYPGGFIPDTYEGPQPWCDVHGLPSVAWTQATRQANDQIRLLTKRYEAELRVWKNLYHEAAKGGTTLTVQDSVKMLRETFCIAQAVVGRYQPTSEHVQRLQRLIDDCDRHRPLGPDGKHNDLHTATCGCEDVTTQPKGPTR